MYFYNVFVQCCYQSYFSSKSLTFLPFTFKALIHLEMLFMATIQLESIPLSPQFGCSVALLISRVSSLLPRNLQCQPHHRVFSYMHGLIFGFSFYSVSSFVFPCANRLVC